jgi:phosphatidylinositol 4-kinase
MHTGVDGTKKPPMVVFRENWQTKEDRVRRQSAFGSHPGWRLLPILVKSNDDLRQEQLASQLIYRMSFILAREQVPVWLCPYEIIAITDRGGVVEAVPDTISLDSLKRNDPDFTDMRTFYHSYFGENTDALADAKSNFVESLAAYSIVTFLLQIKDRHNGNILIDNKGHLIHIDFGFFFLSSPGKNTGFESAPFKLTKDFVEVMGGPESHLFRTFRELCVRSFLALRKHCMEIILLVEMLKSGNEDLNCFLGRPDDAIRGLKERFRLDLSDRACKEYVQSLVDGSLENWRTNWYDRYQRYCVGVL